MSFHFTADRLVLERDNRSRKARTGRGQRMTWLPTLLSFFSLMQSVSAADVTLECYSDYVACEIHLEGPIVKGDADKVLGFVRDPPNRQNIIAHLVLDSPGGEVEEAMRLAEVVRMALITTANWGLFKNGNRQPFDLDRMSPCVSACALVWLAGPERVLKFGRHNRALGLHRPYFSKERYASESPSQLSRKQAEVMLRVREFLASEGMPASVVDAMMNRSSREIYWVPRKEYEAIGKYPAWFEEVLIAKCNFDPDLKRSLEEGRVPMHEAQRTIDKMVAKELALVECKGKLQRDAQLQMRSSAPANTHRQVGR